MVSYWSIDMLACFLVVELALWLITLCSALPGGPARQITAIVDSRVRQRQSIESFKHMFVQLTFSRLPHPLTVLVARGDASHLMGKSTSAPPVQMERYASRCY